MSLREAFQILEIDVTNDKKAIKKAYARLVKQYHPEEYPEEWQRLHQAYETAMHGTGFAQIQAGGYQEEKPVFGELKVQQKEKPISSEPKVQQKEKPISNEPKVQQEEKTVLNEPESRQEEKTVSSEWESRQEEKSISNEQGSQEEPISEEQEIDFIFDAFDTMEEPEQDVQPDAVDEIIRNLKQQSGLIPKNRKNTAKKIKTLKGVLLGIGTYFLIFLFFMAAHKGTNQASRTNRVNGTNQASRAGQTDNKISSYDDLMEMTNWESENWYRKYYLPLLAKQGNQAFREAELEKSIRVQEGVRLTLQRGYIQATTDIYTVYEAEVPEQIAMLVGGNAEDYQIKALCIASNDEPECAVLWWNPELYGFGDAVRIFYYDEENRAYMEVMPFDEAAPDEVASDEAALDEAAFNKAALDEAALNEAASNGAESDTEISDEARLSYKVLEYRTFIIDTHVHTEEEACLHPIVFIEKIENK